MFGRGGDQRRPSPDVTHRAGAPMSQSEADSREAAQRRFQRIEALFNAVADLPPDEAAARLDAEALDPAERAEIDALLAADAGGRAEAALAAVVPAAVEAEQDAERDALIGSRIGAWKLVGTYGVGGMGVVYRAERDDGSFRQIAAVKLVRGLSVSELQISRFVAEREILARLAHPGIARLLDGGSHDGVPWLAMEAVDGQPVDAWCQGRPIAERLALFIQVCAAVQYAHANLIIHRDLKPSNVLVDAAGQPKLLDFGIAKLIQPDETADERTRTQFRMLTPEFASPEQLRGEPVTTASDVYSLGVLLFRLLTGISPYATTDDGKRNPAALAASDDTLTRPSAAVLRGETEDTQGAAGRQLARSLRGDLDAIVMKALRRSPAQRYASAAALADDLQRHLDLLPVLARKESARYQLARFARRHWQGLAATAAAIAMIAGTIAYYTAQLDRRRVEAERERASADEVANFMVSMISESNPRIGKAGRTLRDVLEVATAKIEAGSTLDPQIALRLTVALAKAWKSIEAEDRAVGLLQRAVEGYSSLGMADSLQALEARNLLVIFYIGLRRQIEAENLAVESMKLAEHRYGPNHPIIASLLIGQSWLKIFKQSFDAENLAILRRAESVMTQNGVPPKDENWATLLNRLCVHYSQRAEIGKARSNCQRMLDFSIAARGADSPQTMDAHRYLAYWQFDSGMVRDAKANMLKALDIGRKYYPAEHPFWLLNEYVLAYTNLLSGTFADAVPGKEPIRRPDQASDLAPERKAWLYQRRSWWRLLLEARRFDLLEEALDYFSEPVGQRRDGQLITPDEALELPLDIALASGDGRRALELGRKALEISSTGNDGRCTRCRATRLKLAQAYRMSGDQTSAARELAQAEADIRAAGEEDRLELALLLTERGFVLDDAAAAQASVAMLDTLGIGNRFRQRALEVEAALMSPDNAQKARLLADASAISEQANAAVGASPLLAPSD